ncbi:phosphotransferase [Microbacterium sp. UFMG61]|uniref:phosphotransferase n=1 Tax=Microbacterium sp. UFMG61 TaxID=2745935 RepID=UPI00188E30C8|nr:phosphotransferase [Microbacterium sp. UFMG61]
MHDEEPLSGGNASGSVTRVGATVRKSWTPATDGVHALMRHLREHGIDVAEPLGRDDEGRQIIEFVPGTLALHAAPFTHDHLRRVGAMVRSIHDATGFFSPPRDAVWETAIPAPGDDLVCHNDLAPWNLVIGDRWVFIDWDAAAPSTRLWDLAYAAQAFTLSRVQLPPEDAGRDLRAFIDGYGAGVGLRERLPEAMRERAAAMLDLLATSHAQGREPWASMFAEGHGVHWTAAVDYVDAHRSVWLTALTQASPDGDA